MSICFYKILILSTVFLVVMFSVENDKEINRPTYRKSKAMTKLIATREFLTDFVKIIEKQTIVM